MPQVRCIDGNGAMLGVIAIDEALRRSRDQNLDLVEISPNADPPVCRIMDFGKYKYELNRKEKEARRSQIHAADLKEIKFHANVGDHDFETKMRHILNFLADGRKVKASLYLRGRENIHRELGFEVIKRVIKASEAVSSTDGPPRTLGSSIMVLLIPKSVKGVTRVPSSAPAFTAPSSPAPAVTAPVTPTPVGMPSEAVK